MFNQSLEGIHLPSSLQSLTFGDEFQQSMEGIQLITQQPAKIEAPPELGGAYNYPAVCEVLDMESGLLANGGQPLGFDFMGSFHWLSNKRSFAEAEITAGDKNPEAHAASGGWIKDDKWVFLRWNHDSGAQRQDTCFLSELSLRGIFRDQPIAQLQKLLFQKSAVHSLKTIPATLLQARNR
ncbi:hypothetical protein AK812_SmicGene32789 [Symbiodinium microadriaticum]|uniref:Uncharacterized protein n=1 Tax=Symbiodinium microadriaticum TaxID=2951 RepID=A0A1Q9CTB0_SYMMI|nr:hypothetical protein AK812_SmicGene32789 [Symbiodinium microadriaticum]